MIPQIDALREAGEEEKKLLVDGKLAAIVDGKLYLSLDACEQLGFRVLENNPLMKVAQWLREKEIVMTAAAEPTAENAEELRKLTMMFYSVMLNAAQRGFPIYEAFNQLMKSEDGIVDYHSVLVQWEQNAMEFVEKAKLELGQTSGAN